MTTYTPKAGEIHREWHVVDADGLVLGRLASEVAKILRGKHKPTFTPHQDTGDHVVVINADKVVLTGSKMTDKFVYKHSGYPGGLKTKAYGELLSDRPEEALRLTIGGMLPRNRLGRQMIGKLKIYSGTEHPHAAQSPKVLELEHTRAPGPKVRVMSAPLDNGSNTPKESKDSYPEANEVAESSEEEAAQISEETEGDLRTSLGLGESSLDALKIAGITEVNELVNKTKEEVLAIPKIGPKTVEQIIEQLKVKGLSLRVDG